MAPDPRCAALNNAKQRKGISYGDIAAKIGQTEQHVIDICTAKATPTQAEFDAIARVLGITDAPPANRAHATTS